MASLLLVKGAPDILLDRCVRIVQQDGQTSSLSEQTLGGIKQLKDKWSSEGKRVILLARKIVPHSAAREDGSSLEDSITRELEKDLTLVGLLALIDPPREDIPEVMDILRGAGIRTFMVRLSMPVR